MSLQPGLPSPSIPNSKPVIYLANVFLALDFFLNAVLLGSPEDSISGRLGRAIQSGKPKWFVKPIASVVDYVALHIFGQKDHCINSISSVEDVYRELWSWEA